MSTITIGNRQVGPGQSVLIVAELGGNAAPNYAVAAALVRTAARVGADAVKTQCFTPEAMTLDLDTPSFRLTWAGQEMTLYSLYQQTAMSLEWHAPLKELAESLGLLYFASVFDQAGIDLMVQLGAPALKIASFELTDLPLIRAAVKTNLPLFISWGMASGAECDKTEKTIRRVMDAEGQRELKYIPLKCTSAYPAPLSEANLRLIQRVIAYNGGWIGLSDHTRSNAVVAAAVALGACVVERHLTLARSMGGPDAAFSDEPKEFAAMVQAVRETEAALGEFHYGPTESEVPMLRFRRSLWVVRAVAAGEYLTPDDIRCLRPADGLAPKHWDEVIGKRAQVVIPYGTPLQWEMLE